MADFKAIPGNSQSAFIVCTFSMLAKLSASDGSVSKEEVDRVEQYLKNELELSPQDCKLALRIFREAKDSPLEFRDYAEKFHQENPEQVQLSYRMIQTLLELSISDGYLARQEERMIRSGALLLGLSEPAYERLKREIVPIEAEHH